jgi:hypothetical protein
MTENPPPKYDKYVPERDYTANGHRPFGRGFPDMCGNCKGYYQDLYKRGLTSTPFPPNCRGHVTEPIKHLEEEDFATADDYEKAKVSLDPVAWAIAELDWDARWYQEEMLSCTAKYKVMRCGRRVGKTEGACVALLHHAMTNSNHAILVLAPYESQVANIFQMIRKLIERSSNLTNSLYRDTLNPHRLEFHNGSYLLGFSAGSKTAARSDKIRGQDAHVIYIDEFDYIPDSDIAAISAIMLSHRDCQLWTTSTPTGQHKRFFAICTDKDLGYKEFWLTSMELPHWDDEMELEARRDHNATVESSPEWEHEILAEFGEQIHGVFRNSMIDASLQDYTLGTFKPLEGRNYILGVDWNKTAGTHMVLLEYNGQFSLLDKIIIPRGDFTQTIAVEKIIELHARWKFKGIYVDRGYGSTQVEMLKKHGLRYPETSMHLRLRDFAMQEMTEIRDPTDGTVIKKHTKPFLVNALAEQLDEGRMILPRSEDTRVVRTDQNMGIVQQMRNFQIEGYSVHGLPKYSQGQDHTVTALMLAVGGYLLEHSDLTHVAMSNNIALGPSFGQSQAEYTEEAYGVSGILKDLDIASTRSLDKAKPMLGYTSDASSIRDQYKARRNLDEAIRRGKGLNPHTSRRNVGIVRRKNV